MKGPYLIFSFNRRPDEMNQTFRLWGRAPGWKYFSSGKNADGTPRYHLARRVVGDNLFDLNTLQMRAAEMRANDLLLIVSKSSFINQTGLTPEEVFN